MKTFVINLERDSEKRLSMVKQLVATKLDFEIVPAIDGKLMPEVELNAAYDQERALKFIHRRLTAGEVGCALSHLKVLRHIVSTAIPMALVLEDDALITTGALDVLKTLEHLQLAEEPRVFILTHVLKYSAWKRKPATQDGKYSLYPVFDAYCAHGYVVTNTAAKRLLVYFENLHHPIDYWNVLRRKRVVKISGVVPYCIGNTALASGSEIDKERREISAHLHLTWAAHIRNMMRRYLWEKFLYQLAKPFLRIRRQEKVKLERVISSDLL